MQTPTPTAAAGQPAKHTPGPWAVNPLQLNQVCGADASHSVAMATVLHPAAVTIANARLMAAAPELLAALETVVADWTAQFERNGHMAPRWCKQARAAIAKATSTPHENHLSPERAL